MQAVRMTSGGFGICAVLLLTIATRGNANQCMHCIGQGSERGCDDAGDHIECNEELAEKYLSLFMRVNENLDVESADKKRYKCFKFAILGEEAFYLKGCTYESLPICDNMEEGMLCSTCSERDCNSMYYESYSDDSDRAGALVSSIGLTAVCVSAIGMFYFAQRH